MIVMIFFCNNKPKSTSVCIAANAFLCKVTWEANRNMVKASFEERNVAYENPWYGRLLYVHWSSYVFTLLSVKAECLNGFFSSLYSRLKIVKISFKCKQFFIQLRREAVSVYTYTPTHTRNCSCTLRTFIEIMCLMQCLLCVVQPTYRNRIWKNTRFTQTFGNIIQYFCWLNQFN